MSYEKYKDIATNEQGFEAKIRIATVANILHNPEADVDKTLEVLYWTAWGEGYEKGISEGVEL